MLHDVALRIIPHTTQIHKKNIKKQGSKSDRKMKIDTLFISLHHEEVTNVSCNSRRALSHWPLRLQLPMAALYVMSPGEALCENIISNTHAASSHLWPFQNMSSTFHPLSRHRDCHEPLHNLQPVSHHISSFSLHLSLSLSFFIIYQRNL